MGDHMCYFRNASNLILLYFLKWKYAPNAHNSKNMRLWRINKFQRNKNWNISLEKFSLIFFYFILESTYLKFKYLNYLKSSLEFTICSFKHTSFLLEQYEIKYNNLRKLIRHGPVLQKERRCKFPELYQNPKIYMA